MWALISAGYGGRVVGLGVMVPGGRPAVRLVDGVGEESSCAGTGGGDELTGVTGVTDGSTDCSAGL